MDSWFKEAVEMTTEKKPKDGALFAEDDLVKVHG